MNRPLLCVTAAAKTTADLLRARDAAERAGAEMVELRLDGVQDLDVAASLQGRRTPVIATCRPVREGGQFDGVEQERRGILEAASRLGAEFVDVEARASFAPDLIRARNGRGVIASAHHFGNARVDAAAEMRLLRETGAEVAKLAVTADRLTDLLPLHAVADQADPEGRSHVLIGMGTAGMLSRVFAARLRNRWSYAGDGVAPGQIPVGRMLEEFRFDRIRQDTDLYGVVGNPVSHSRSPAMHNAGFAALGLNAAYVPLQAAEVADFVAFARAAGLRGASITAPFKVGLMAHVDEIDPVAERVGAINTLIVRGDRWIGANTDVAGFLAPLAGRIALRGVRATILGAGGAARAVAAALSSQGAIVTVSARRRAAAQLVAAQAGGRAGEFPPRAGTWDVLVNATSAGAGPGGINPIEGSALDGEIVFDLVYSPAETPLLAAARDAGCLTIGGLEMLIAQAERQFELWTGQTPPRGLFHAAASATAGDPSTTDPTAVSGSARANG
jgi:3-dehydroquinate dehydratase / shikimate dehydrogenase